jgi:hypothetical protein
MLKRPRHFAIANHEAEMSRVLEMKPSKKLCLAISRWSKKPRRMGGDFIMIVANKSKSYFYNKGYNTIL